MGMRACVALLFAFVKQLHKYNYFSVSHNSTMCDMLEGYRMTMCMQDRVKLCSLQIL